MVLYLQASGLSEAGGGDDDGNEAGGGSLNLQLLDVSESVDDLDDAVAQGELCSLIGMFGQYCCVTVCCVTVSNQVLMSRC
jgi:hypothetical protein